jgi:hypothetical protein
MKDELYIINEEDEYEKLDLAENIQLKYESNLFRPFDEFSNSSSYTISLPKTARNRRLMDAIDIPNTLNGTPYIKQSARVVRDGVVLIEGADVAIMRVTEDAYELNLFWGAGMIEDNDYTLQDLELGEVEFARDENEFTYPYKCGFNAGQDDDAKIPPTYPCYDLLLKCCDKLGMKIRSDDGVTEGFGDVEKARFDGLVMPFLNAADNGEEVNLVSATINMRTAMRYPPFFVFPNNPDRYDRVTTFGDNGNTEYWIGAVPMQRFLQARLEGTLDVTIPIDCKANLDNLSVGISIYGTSAITEDGVFLGYGRLANWIKSYVYTDSTKTDTARTFHFNFDSDDAFSKSAAELTNKTYGTNMMFVIELSTCAGHSQNHKLFSSIHNATFDFSDCKLRVAYDHVVPNEGQMFDYALNMPDMDCVDYITAMCAITGIALVPIEGEFYPRTYSRMIAWASSQNPKTTNIIKYDEVTSEIKEIEFHDDDYAKTNYFRYADNEDRDWDASLPCDDWTLESETDLVTLPFNTYKTVDSIPWVELYTYDDDGLETFEEKSDNPIFCTTRHEKVDGVTQYFCSEGRTWTMILDDYYKEYAAVINPFRVYKITIRFGAERLATLDMTKPLYLQKYGLFFFIRSVTTGDDDMCEFELIKIRFTDEKY